jgi:uncharacterized protein (TIGR02246 family)
MKKVIAAIAVMASLMGLSYSTAGAAEQKARAEDEATIRAIVIRLQDGWNAGDSKAFAAPFAEEADYVVINGMQIKGRAVIDAGHRQIFDTIYKGSHNTASIKSVRFIRDDVAVAHVAWHLKFREGDTPREAKAIATMVFTKEKGQWSITAFQNTGIAPAQR